MDCYEVILEDINFESVDYLTKTTKEIELLKQPYIFLKDNVYKTIEKDAEVHITGISEDFVRINYEDEDYYVNDLEFYIRPIPEEVPSNSLEPTEEIPKNEPTPDEPIVVEPDNSTVVLEENADEEKTS